MFVARIEDIIDYVSTPTTRNTKIRRGHPLHATDPILMEDFRLTKHLEYLVQRQVLQFLRLWDTDLLSLVPLGLFILLIVHHQVSEDREDLAYHCNERLAKLNLPDLPSDERRKS